MMKALSDWWYRSDYAIFIVLFVGLGGLFAFFLWLDQRDLTACRARGGEPIVTGHHYQTTFIMSGKTIIPMVQYVTDYGCSR